MGCVTFSEPVWLMLNLSILLEFPWWLAATDFTAYRTKSYDEQYYLDIGIENWYWDRKPPPVLVLGEFWRPAEAELTLWRRSWLDPLIDNTCLPNQWGLCSRE